MLARAANPLLVVVTGLAATLGIQVAHLPTAAAAPAPATPGLSLSAAASLTSVSRVGQAVDYAFVVANAGDQSLRNLLVAAPSPGLSVLTCSPVALGGALEAGQTTTCRASRMTAVPDLSSATVTDVVRATAVPGTGSKPVSATASVSVAVRALAPKPTDDSVPAVDGDRP